MPAALFGITNDGLNLFVNLLVVFFVILWVALAAWTYFDARRRIRDNFLVGCATTGSLIFPYLGAIVYAIIRPPEFLDDARERDLEIRAAELRVRQLEEASCPNCGYPIERTYLRCPSCRVRVKDPCETCAKPIDPRWRICPYCETPVEGSAPPTRRAAATDGRRADATRGRTSRSKRSSSTRAARSQRSPG